MPFRHLLPMAKEMGRQKAQAMLRDIRVARLGLADHKDPAFSDAMNTLALHAARQAPEPKEPQPKSVDGLRRTMAAMGLQEVQ